MLSRHWGIKAVTLNDFFFLFQFPKVNSELLPTTFLKMNTDKQLLCVKSKFTLYICPWFGSPLM